MDGLRAKLPTLKGKPLGSYTVAYADDFSYTDPIDNSVSQKQGIRIGFDGGGRAVFRLSGTGTVGATIRVYLERLETDPARLDMAPDEALAPIISAALSLSDLKAKTGRDKPNVIT